MKKLYLVSAIIVAVLILILAFAQFGSTCVWYLINSNTKPVLVILWVACLGAVLGGLLVMWWKAPKPGSPSEIDDGDDSE